MGKKVTRASAKITKNMGKKQLLHGLIKVMRPKVFITDSSSFKTLVQQLTGNQTVLSSFKQTVDHVLPITAVDNSLQLCSSDSFADSMETCSQLLFSPDSQEVEHTSNHSYLDNLIPEHLSRDQVISPGYSDVESWLLDAEPYPLCQDELLSISIHDYDISAVLFPELF